MQKDINQQFLLQRFELIISNMLTRYFVLGEIKSSRKELLDLVRMAGKESHIAFLEKDVDTYLKFLKKLKQNNPHLKEPIDDQIAWVSDVLIPAIQEQKRLIYRKSKIYVNESYLQILVERSLVDTKLYPFFILLTNTPSILSKTIEFVTKDPYTHVSVSLDSSLEHMYSFGIKDKISSLGFISEESIKTGFLGRLAKGTNYALYYVPMTKESLDKIHDKINELVAKKLNYSIRGLINIHFNKISDFGDKYFCSWFVADLLKLADESMIEKHPSLYTPYSLAFLPNVNFISSGKLTEYDKNYTDKKIKEAGIHYISRSE